MKRMRCWAAVSCIVLLPVVCHAATRTVDATAATIIVSPEGAGRALIQFPSALDLEDAMVSKARLLIPRPADGLGDQLPLRVRAVSREWSPGTVSWTVPWSEPGGDTHPGVYGKGDYRAGATTHISVDVSSLMLEVLGGRETFGLMLTVPESAGLGFTQEETDRLGSVLSNAKLEISYRNRGVPPRLRD